MQVSQTCAHGLVAASVLWLATTASNAAYIRTQPPCVNSDGYCVFFEWVTPTLPIIRSLAFSAPAKSTAQVTFHGSLLCTAIAADSEKVVDIAGQIVGAPSSLVNQNGPGGLRHSVTLDEYAANVSGPRFVQPGLDARHLLRRGRH